MNGAVRGLQILLDVGATGSLSDGELLDRFLARGDGAVFEAIVDRHGPMVWGVCRRVLRDHHDAQDAFQATFLVLARRAASVVPREKLGHWLYGVAYRTALKARSTRAKRRAREAPTQDVPEPPARPGDRRIGLAESLDRELSRLPEKYRIPIILCDLEGRSHKEAAGRLGWPIGTVSGRLSRARSLLAQRLVRRGVSLSIGSLVAFMSEDAAMAGAPTWLVKTGRIVGEGPTAMAAPLSKQVMSLAKEVQGGMMMTKLKAAATVLAAAFLATGAAVMAYTQDGHPPTGDMTIPREEPTSRVIDPGKDGGSMTKSYYVGDLVVARPGAPSVDGLPDIDFATVVDLITSTIAPSTWQAGDRPDRSIKPFRGNITLIIRHEPEVHERIEALLQGLRRRDDLWAAALGHGPHERFEEVFFVGDLLGPGASPDFEPVIDLVIATIAPGTWTRDPATVPGIFADPVERTLVVRHNRHVLDQVKGLLDRLRRFQEARGIGTKDRPGADREPKP
ncbi:RNA polymerase sigma factor [Paludisphaera mucosa]|uniref:RNA polymerase sigma factor n=1 Tax=Paludisphaera mucosa TaxID=3030827 RepID=A0ABT6FGV4_9BACT|nr:RNA polymerase sigma factor [Paludisphaera mucosa]MDG3006804.1 RNA polymerase sigma factor [Paludisphaera mucosa]